MGQPKQSYCYSGEDTVNSCNNTINNIIKNQKTTENTITESGTIVVQDRSGSYSAGPNCNPIERTVSLGPSTMTEDGMRVIAILSPCHLEDGTVLLNLPENGIEIVAAHIEGGESVDALVAEKEMVSDLWNGQALYSVDLDETMTGPTPNEEESNNSPG